VPRAFRVVEKGTRGELAFGRLHPIGRKLWRGRRSEMEKKRIGGNLRGVFQLTAVERKGGAVCRNTSAKMASLLSWTE